jgi:hypothetical protein
MEFTSLQNKNFQELSKTTSLAVVAFSIFGTLNAAGLLSTIPRGGSSYAILIRIASIVLIISCFFAAIAFKKASKSYYLIVTTENNDLALLSSAGQQLQRALTWAAVTTVIILIRSANFHLFYDLTLK